MNDVTSRFLGFYKHLLSVKAVSSASDFAKNIDISTSLMNEITKGRSNVGVSALQNTVSKFKELSSEWLMTGEGDMLKSDKVVGLKKFEEPETGYANMLTIPVVDIESAAGSGALNNDHIEVLDIIQLPTNLIKGKGRLLCARLKGESMSPTLQHGGHVIISEVDRGKWAHLRDEHIYTIVTKDGVTRTKRVKNRFKSGFIVLMSDNPDKASYPSLTFYEEDIHMIWYVEWYFTAKMPNIHDQYYTRLQRLEDEVDQIRLSLKGKKFL